MPTPEPSRKPADAYATDLTGPAIIAGAVAVALFGMFWLVTTPEYRSHVMGSFIALIAIVGGALLAAIARPRQVGHGLAGLFGAASLLSGLYTMFTGPLAFLLSLVLVVMGVAMVLMTAYSLNHSRPAWAFLSALIAVMGVCTLFGAPKVKNLLGVNMWLALLVPGLLAVTCAALGIIAEEYRETFRPRR